MKNDFFELASAVYDVVFSDPQLEKKFNDFAMNHKGSYYMPYAVRALI